MTVTDSDLKNIREDVVKVAIKDSLGIPNVSVIVPAYNTEKYISKCLNSLIKQTLKNIEIIVVDDGSFDSTSQIAEIYSECDARVKLIKQTHSMQGAARNLGTINASGEYIGYVDADDWVDEDYYEKMYKAAIKYSSDIALATNVRIGKGKTKKRLNIQNEIFVTGLQEKIDISKQAKNPCPTNKIYKKDFLSKNNINWEEGIFCEDKLFTIKAVYYANGIVTVPDVNYYYYRNPNSTVNTKSKEHLDKLLKDKASAKESVLKFLKDMKADIRDCEFWAVTETKKIFNFTVLIKKESLHTAKYLLFGIIPIAIIKE